MTYMREHHIRVHPDSNVEAGVDHPNLWQIFFKIVMPQQFLNDLYAEIVSLPDDVWSTSPVLRQIVKEIDFCYKYNPNIRSRK